MGTAIPSSSNNTDFCVAIRRLGLSMIEFSLNGLFKVFNGLLNDFSGVWSLTDKGLIGDDDDISLMKTLLEGFFNSDNFSSFKGEIGGESSMIMGSCILIPVLHEIELTTSSDTESLS